MEETLDFSKDAKGPDLRSEKQKKEDWIRESVEYTNPNLKKRRPAMNFPPPTEQELEHMKNTDIYGNPRK
jgi:hypothetical protein